MAITWASKITPIDVSTFQASIVATRTDSEDPDNPMVYEVSRASLETEADQLKVAEEIRAKHVAAVAATAAVDSFVSAKEAALNAYLEARENG